MVGGGPTGNRGKSSVGMSMRYRRRNLSLVARSGQMKRAVQKHEALARDRTAASARRQSLACHVGSASLSRAVGLEGSRADACCCCDLVGEGSCEAGMLREWSLVVDGEIACHGSIE